MTWSTGTLLAFKKDKWQDVHLEMRNLFQQCGLETELCYSLRALSSLFSCQRRCALGRDLEGGADAHRPGQRDHAVLRSSPECSVEGLEGVAENISPLVGTHQWSCALSILSAFCFSTPCLSKKTHLERNPAPLGKQELVQLPSK